MLTITIPAVSLFDQASQKFLSTEAVTLELEHSLVSLSKWESKFMKPFLSSGEKTPEEIIAYIEAMVLTPDFDPECLAYLNQDNLDEINHYLESPRSATTFAETNQKSSKKEIITSELIYYWLVAYTIPFEAQYWHLNRLLTLVRICNVKNSKEEKKSKAQIAQERRALNAQRRAQMNTSG